MAGIASKTAAAALIATLFLASPASAQRQSLAQDLSSCAGAVAAQAQINVLTFPEGASGELAPLLASILERLNVEPGVEGMTGRYAASAAREFWSEQSSARREAAVNRCRTRFGGAQ